MKKIYKSFDEWWDIPNHFPYQISKRGFIKRVYKTKNPKPVKQRKTWDGYSCVCLSINNKKTTKTVHRLMSMTFMGDRPLNAHINHKDKNKNNNSLENLEYITATENEHHKKFGAKRGATFDKSRGKWVALIKVKGVSITIGRYDVKDDAYNAYNNKYIEIYQKNPW